MKDIRTRFNKAYWINEANKDLEILIVGIGGSGSALCVNLIKALPAHYILMDHDKVSKENLATQNFINYSSEFFKARTMKEMLQNFASITPLIQKYKEGDTVSNITICCIDDSMTVRKAMFEKWKTLENRELFIECRLAATCFEIFFVKKGQEELYNKFIFEDTEASKVSCFMKQTPQIANLLGAKMTQIICNYFGNKYLGEEFYDVPFYYKEIGENLTIEKKYEQDYHS